MIAITLILLRKRVFTKSPVRENRTPGSVRGLPGNWQSYRDQLVFGHCERDAVFVHQLRKCLVRHVRGVLSWLLSDQYFFTRDKSAAWDSVSAAVSKSELPVLLFPPLNERLHSIDGNAQSVPIIWNAAGLNATGVNMDAGGNNALLGRLNFKSPTEPTVLGNVVVASSHPCATSGWVELRTMK